MNESDTRFVSESATPHLTNDELLVKIKIIKHANTLISDEVARLRTEAGDSARFERVGNIAKYMKAQVEEVEKDMEAKCDQ